MRTIVKGEWLIFPDYERSPGFDRALVLEVTADRVIAKGVDGEDFDLSRRDLEEHGFAPNGSPHDPIFTAEGWLVYLESGCSSHLAESDRGAN